MESGLYGNYSLYFPNILEYRSLLSDLHKHSHESEITYLKEIYPPASSLDTNNSIYMISNYSNPSSSSTNEDPPDQSRHQFRDNWDVLKTSIGFTPFHLVHSVESILSIEFQIPSIYLAIEVLLDT